MSINRWQLALLYNSKIRIYIDLLETPVPSLAGFVTPPVYP